MPITSTLNTTLAGLQNTEARINVLSANVSNADKDGYTKKELQTSYISVNGQTVALSSTVETANFNPFLLENLIEDTSSAAYYSILEEYMENYTNELGTIDGNNTLTSLTSELATALDTLAITPEDSSLKNAVVAYAERLATEMRRTSESIQDYRLQVDQNIERTVISINESIDKIAKLNEKIVDISATKQSTANLEDERNAELETLSALLNIDYFINNNNEVQIYTGGRPLLDSHARTINYTAASNVSVTSLYPSGFNPIDLDGYDITTSLKKGELAGLVNLRDSFFVEEQEKLDEYANVLMRELNTILNTGASVPPRSNMIGDTEGLTPVTAFSATGTVRIATTDSDGVVQNYADINLVGAATISDVITAINTALGPDVTASLTADGALQIVANNAGEGLALNQMTSSVAPSSESFSMFFGLNNLYKGQNSTNIAVSDYLIADGQGLATASLTGGALAIGDTGVFVGDSTITTAMNDAFVTDYSFAAAGNFAAQTESLANYVSNIISDAAYRSSNAGRNEEIYTSLKDETKTALQNLSAVNIDEEMANLIDLEAKYEASATMIATIQEMYDALLMAVR